MEVSTKTRINLLVQKNGSYTAIVDKSKRSKRELSAMKQLSDDLGYAMVTVGPKVKQVRDLTACTCGSRDIAYTHMGNKKVNVCKTCGNTWYSSFSISKKQRVKTRFVVHR